MIYIACPSRFATGGTELLHQLFCDLKQHTENVRIFYYDFDGLGSPTADRFLKYQVCFVTKINDYNENLIIVPEISSGISLLKRYTEVKKVIWWLSVDNYLLSNHIGIYKHLFFEEGLLMLVKHTFMKLIQISNLKSKKSGYVDFYDDAIIHLYQSEYARLFLLKNGMKNVYALSDYINEELISPEKPNKENILLYNPAKGKKLTLRIIKHLKKLKPVGLRGMSLLELSDNYSRAKVYIDFGYHPGKDRIPREAAINNCLVFTNIKGSAMNDVDIPIPVHYKINTAKINPKEIALKIEQFADDYNNKISDFTTYKDSILKERELFSDQVSFLYHKILINYSKESYKDA